MAVCKEILTKAKKKSLFGRCSDNIINFSVLIDLFNLEFNADFKYVIGIFEFRWEYLQNAIYIYIYIYISYTECL